MMKMEINWKSRTVWTGISMVAFGIAGLAMPDLRLSQAPDLLVGTGLGLIFLKS